MEHVCEGCGQSVADVYIRIDRVSGIAPPSSAIDGAKPAEPVVVPVFGTRGFRTVKNAITMTVGHRTARRLRVYALVLGPLRRIVAVPFGALLILHVTTMLVNVPPWRGRLLQLVPLMLMGVIALGFMTVVWTARPRHQPIDTGEGWVHVRHVDPAAAREWQERNPGEDIVVRESPAGGVPKWA